MSDSGGAVYRKQAADKGTRRAQSAYRVCVLRIHPGRHGLMVTLVARRHHAGSNADRILWRGVLDGEYDVSTPRAIITELERAVEELKRQYAVQP